MPKKTIGDEKAERINIFLPPDVLAKVKANAEAQGLSVSAYIRMLVMQTMKDE